MVNAPELFPKVPEPESCNKAVPLSEVPPV
jgi:hypothetical protein